MQGTQTLLAMSPLAQPGMHTANRERVIVGIDDALHYLHQQRWHALLIDLSDNARAGFALLEAVLAAELMKEITPPALLLAGSIHLQTLNENLLRLKGFDQILPLPLAEALPLEEPKPADLRELHALARQQQPVIDAMLPRLLQTLDADITHLETMRYQGTLMQIADLAHRMKSSWHLLGMRRARRGCIIMERLPALINDGVISAENSLKMRESFISMMFDEHRQLQELIRIG